MVIFHSYVSLPEGISYIFLLDWLESLQKKLQQNSRLDFLVDFQGNRKSHAESRAHDAMLGVQQVIPGNLEDFQF